MGRYLIVGHRTLGGPHLHEHLESLRAADGVCDFHVLVPEHPAPGWSDFETRAEAEARMTEMLHRLASLGIQASGEVGPPDPVGAVRAVLACCDVPFDAVILSTLPYQYSRWWNVAGDLRRAFPSLPLTHLVADRSLAH